MRMVAWSLSVLLFTGALAGKARAQAPGVPAAPDEVTRLREELQQLRATLATLEARLLVVETAAPPAGAAPVGPAAPPVDPALSLPTPAGGSASKVFNPDISVIGDFLGAVGRSPGGGEPSLEMHEAEASFQAVVDPYARADFFFAFTPQGVDVEEAFLSFPTLPGGLLVKVGKMRTAFGKVDGMHNHVSPWTDRPLVTNDLVGGEEGLGDAGISVSRLFPNSFAFVELTGQVYRGDSAVFQAKSRGDLTYVGHLRAYRDLSESANVDLGGSIAYGHDEALPGETTRLFGVDATFRFRPLRRAIYRRFIARSELVWSRRRADLLGTSAFGTYLSLEYQFARRWYAGSRLDWSERNDDASLRDKGASLLLTFWPSEFSQVRGQYRQTRFAEGRTAHEVLFQFLFAIGAHGAHTF